MVLFELGVLLIGVGIGSFASLMSWGCEKPSDKKFAIATCSVPQFVFGVLLVVIFS